MEMFILFLWLYSIFCIADGQVDGDHRNLNRRMTSLEDLVQTILMEFGGVREKNSELEYKYRVLSEELHRLRVQQENVTPDDISDTVGKLSGGLDQQHLVPITGSQTSQKTRRDFVSKPGPKGDKGDPGPKGNNGIPGFNGDDGLDGEKGDKGEPGRQGPKGSAGISGFNGDDGQDGKYQAVRDHHVGLSHGSRWVCRPKGQDGAKGDVGPTGPKGEVGLAGSKGDAGMPGTLGADGRTGQKGDTGNPGITGSKGDTGSTGKTGSKGDSGSPGIVGPKGATGATGRNGEKGATGDMGFTGLKGDKGGKGSRGYVGFHGQKGEPGQTVTGTNTKVAFSAMVINPILNIKQYAVIEFKDQKLNIGSFYNPFQGTFQCGVPGVYMFSWSIVVKAGCYLITSLDVNGVTMGKVSVDNPAHNIGSGSNTVILDLNRGDVVAVKVLYTLGAGLFIGHGSSFSGYLLH